MMGKRKINFKKLASWGLVLGGGYLLLKSGDQSGGGGGGGGIAPFLPELGGLADPSAPLIESPVKRVIGPFLQTTPTGRTFVHGGGAVATPLQKAKIQSGQNLLSAGVAPGDIFSQLGLSGGMPSGLRAQRGDITPGMGGGGTSKVTKKVSSGGNGGGIFDPGTGGTFWPGTAGHGRLSGG